MTTSETTATTTTPKKINIRFSLIFIVLIGIGITYGIIKYMHALKHEETDDAQVETLISPVIPHVSGYIAKVSVSDNEVVHKGDTLVVLDDRDLQIDLLKAQAELAAAESNISLAQAGVPVSRANIQASRADIATAEAQIEAAEVNLWRTTQDFERYQSAIKDGGVTQQQYEQALAAKQSAERQLQVLQAQKRRATEQAVAVSSQESVSQKQVSVAQTLIEKNKAAIDAAKLALSYTVITAQVDGQVSKINLQTGQFVQAGQSLFTIVPQDDKWIVANFKETQLTKMKIGQEVSISVDAFPDKKIAGVVTSFSPITGAKQSLLPPDNASGNFIKTVQRLPVKIEFLNPDSAFMKKLKAGMNVGVDVHLNSIEHKG